MKFIVTGGAGFIGHNVVKQLTEQGHSCVIIDNVTTYDFVPQAELNYLFTERMARTGVSADSVHRTDLRDHPAVSQLFNTHAAGVDAVIHLASFPRQKVVSANPVWGSEVMTTALVNLLELTAKHQIPKFVYISSSMVYGDFNNDVSEDATCAPQGQYGIMKYMGELLVQDYARRGLFTNAIIRPSAVYGEWDVEDRVVSKFMLNAMRGNQLKVNGPSEVLDFSYVEDTAAGIVLAATKPEANGNVYNITRSDSKLYTLGEAAQIAVTIAGSGELVINGREAGFPSRGRLSIDRAVHDLGYAPTVSVEEGFRRYHSWFESSTYWGETL
jgi:nucleoside-diphosphate-sugar epimerase